MKELFVLINDKFASAACGSWTASEPHNGTFLGIQHAVYLLRNACPDYHGEDSLITRISFAELEYDPVDYLR